MTRFLPLLIAASLIASPSLAAGFLFDLPKLSFPQTDPTMSQSVTQSTSGQTAPATAQPRP